MSLAEAAVLLLLITAVVAAGAVAFAARLPWNRATYGAAVSVTSSGKISVASEAFIAHLTPTGGERVLVRPAADDDGPHIRATMDDEVIGWMGWLETDLGAPREWERISGHLLRMTGHLIVVDKSNDEILGVINVSHADLVERRCEIGMWMGPKRRGDGLAREALELGLEALHRGGIETVRIHTARDNKRMRRIVEQAGAEPMIEAEHQLPNGDVVDAVLYAHLQD